MDNLITSDYVRATCLNKATYDSAKFQPYLTIVEEHFIRPFLGDDLFEEIIGQNLSNTLSVANTALLAYLKPAIAWFVLHKALPFIQMDITSSGIQINNSEFASSGTDKQRGDLVSEALNNANIYMDRAKKFLEADAQADTYPLYEAGGNITNDTNIIGGLILDSED